MSNAIVPIHGGCLVCLTKADDALLPRELLTLITLEAIRRTGVETVISELCWIHRRRLHEVKP